MVKYTPLPEGVPEGETRGNSSQYFQYSIFQNDILYPYQDETRDIRSNITLRLKEFPRAKPAGTPEGEGVYLTVYTELSPSTDSIVAL